MSDEFGSTQPELSEPLFENSSVSMLQAYFMIFQFALKHHLSSKAFSDLLLLFKTLLPAANSLPKSIYLFKSFFVKTFSLRFVSTTIARIVTNYSTVNWTSVQMHSATVLAARDLSQYLSGLTWCK